MAGHASEPESSFFRVPPFPYARRPSLVRPHPVPAIAQSDEQIDELMRLTASSRVGGTFWGRQPELPDADYILVRIRDAATRSRLLRSLPASKTVIVWLDSAEQHASPSLDAQTVVGCCDPWHLVSRAERIYADANDELSLIAALSRRPLHCLGDGPFKGLDDANGTDCASRAAFREAVLERNCFVSPFSGTSISPFEAIQLCRHWRALIDRNRGLAGAIGFARWKRPTVSPLLWGGSEPIPFVSRPSISSNDKEGYAIWRSRVPLARLAEFERFGHRLIEVEDGFIRSVGLGADCVPPLSLVVDNLGIYFDPSRPSELERLLQDQVIPSETIDRAKRLRQLIVEQGVGKYGSARPASDRGNIRPGSILVPGQVEDDRSIICGGGKVRSNLELLRRVRADAPNSHIIYKPHPDVEAGHRPGNMPDHVSLTLANEVARDRPISDLFAEVEAVHVNTSLAGFEALLRGKSVTAYGVPFYAGWGLTRDLGPVPPRRTARRSLDELVAAALLIYPRYLDPVTGIPCPPEVLLDRLAQSPESQRRGVLVPLRRLQGRMKRLFSSNRSMLA